MSSLILLLLFIGTISATFNPTREFEVKQTSLFNNGRSYTITEVGKLRTTDDPNRFKIQNELLSLGKKLVLLDHGQPLYELKHKLGHLYQKWNIYDPKSGDTLASLKHLPSVVHDSYKVKSAKLGNFRITGNIGSRTFSIKKDGHKVAEVHKRHFHMHDTYSVKIEANQDPAIILLMTIGIDEIRQH